LLWSTKLFWIFLLVLLFFFCFFIPNYISIYVPPSPTTFCDKFATRFVKNKNFVRCWKSRLFATKYMISDSIVCVFLAAYNKVIFSSKRPTAVEGKAHLYSIWLSRARLCNRLWSPGIDSARLGIDSWAP